MTDLLRTTAGTAVLGCLLWFMLCFIAQHPTITTTTSSRVLFARTISFPPSPVIGVLAQPFHQNNNSDYTTQEQQYYIAASYIKWLEAGGARSIAIPYQNVSTELLDDLFDQINAIFLPGGASEMPWTVTYLLDKAVQSNRQGDYFPVWGTCLGFEFLVKYFGGKSALQSGFVAENRSWPLEQVSAVGLYQEATVYKTVTLENVTLNNHHQGIEPHRFRNNSQLNSLFQVTSVNNDNNGRLFVSTMEPRDPFTFPFYGVQYHPEKNAFEYATYPHSNIPYEDINHSPTAIQFSMSMAQFVVNLARNTKALEQQQGQLLVASLLSRQTRTINYDDHLAPPRHHAYTKPDRFPVVTTYPQQSGLKFEEVYIVPTWSYNKKH